MAVEECVGPGKAFGRRPHPEVPGRRGQTGVRASLARRGKICPGPPVNFCPDNLSVQQALPPCLADDLVQSRWPQDPARRRMARRAGRSSGPLPARGTHYRPLPHPLSAQPPLPATPQFHLGLGLEHLLCARDWPGRHRDEVTAGPGLQSAQNLCKGDKSVDPSEAKASKNWPRGGPGLL